MKLPRWLVIGMLTSSVLAVLAAAGWWWVTWPERTAREFVDLMGSGRYNELPPFIQSSWLDNQDWEHLMGSPMDSKKFMRLRSNPPDYKSVFEPRSWVDLCCGRASCEVNNAKFEIECYRFTVERGKVVNVDFLMSGTISTDQPMAAWLFLYRRSLEQKAGRKLYSQSQ